VTYGTHPTDPDPDPQHNTERIKGKKCLSLSLFLRTPITPTDAGSEEEGNFEHLFNFEANLKISGFLICIDLMRIRMQIRIQHFF
jgi:hypothetical protein